MRRPRPFARLGRLVLAALCIACGCELSEADVVARSPDVAIARDVPSGTVPSSSRDAADAPSSPSDAPEAVHPNAADGQASAPVDVSPDAEGGGEADASADDGADRVDTGESCDL